jgi:hypothetical protein
MVAAHECLHHVTTPDDRHGDLSPMTIEIPCNRCNSSRKLNLLGSECTLLNIITKFNELNCTNIYPKHFLFAMDTN